MREDDQIADWYCAVRDPEVGASELAALVRKLSPGARVLDVGCGDGEPVSRLLASSGFEVVGLDSSREMVRRYRARFPEAEARCERVQEARFGAKSFGAVVAWGVLFHLAAAEQEAALVRMAGWLEPGGWLLFTSGAEVGEREGAMEGVAFRYVSLGVEGYRSVLERAGVRLAYHHADAWENYVYAAQKR
jgi:2-polyprenyl-3-methyl-5-hydroxy-6-metoxy-1,4-benzoquinol methylase